MENRWRKIARPSSLKWRALAVIFTLTGALSSPLILQVQAAQEVPLGGRGKLLSCIMGLREHSAYSPKKQIYAVERSSGPPDSAPGWGATRYKRGGQEGYLFFNDQRTEFVPLAASDRDFPAARALITLSDGTVFKCDKLGADELQCPYEIILKSDTGDKRMDRDRKLYNENSELLSIEIARLPLPERIERYEKERKITFTSKSDDIGRMVSRWVVTSGSPATATENESLRGLSERQIRGSLQQYAMDYRRAWDLRLKDLELQRLMAMPDYKPQSGLLGLVNKMRGNSPKPAPNAELWNQGLNRCTRVDQDDIGQQILSLQALIRMTSSEFSARERQIVTGVSCPAR